MSECHTCTNYLERDRICFACYQKLICTIEQLRKEVRLFRDAAGVLPDESHKLGEGFVSMPIAPKGSCL